MLNTKALAATAAAPKVYIEDVMSVFLYTGNGSTQTITNGIDLSGKGGLVWCKSRSAATEDHILTATPGKALKSNLTNAEQTTTRIDAFNSNGFYINSSLSDINQISNTYASWTFRKQAKFFDVVTYTGNGSNRTISHSLGSVPGCIIVKRTDTTGDWQVYHRSLANTEYLVLNTTAAKATGTTRWNSTTPTSTEFSLGTDATVNANTGTYVAYLFAHDAGGFGDSGNDSVISCGSYTGNGTVTGPVINLGWEPQWLLIKRASGGTADWWALDVMRGWGVDTAKPLYPNLTLAEGDSSALRLLSNGFQPTSTNSAVNTSSSEYIYIAIRRGPMKTPTDATKVFSANTISATGLITTGFPVDFNLIRTRTAGALGYAASRMTGDSKYLDTTTTGAEATSSGTWKFSFNTQYENQAVGGGISWAFQRAPSFMDVVAYTGTGSARTVSHNLGVVPELMIVKRRNGAEDWLCYHGSLGILSLNSSGSSFTNSTYWNNTAPTSSVFSLGTSSGVNGSTNTFIAYLFGTVAGVSKVGSYTGTGTTKDIDCGFTAGARFVLIKRTDDTGDWYVWDTARGIVSADDPYLLLNSAAIEVTNTDYIDPLSSGFQISSTAPAAINANGGSFIYLAIA